MSRDQAAWDDISEQDDNFDYKKLYITNIPPHLNEDGLRHVFSKFGTLSMCFLNRDKSKRYGLVQYDTAGEAKVAMLSTNQTPPLNLKIALAKKKSSSKETNVSKPKNNFMEKRVVNVVTDKPHDSNQNLENNDTESVTTVRSWGKRSIILPNVETETLCGDEDLSMLDEVQLNLESERIEFLKAQHRFKVALFNAEKKNQLAGNKPNIQITMRQDGKYIYKTSDDRPMAKVRFASVLKGARGPYDDLTNDFQHNNSISELFGPGVSTSSWSGPSLVPFAALQCVRCSDAATSLCARCRLTPYCSQHCQRADWTARHSAVCHNLASNLSDMEQDKIIGGSKIKIDPVTPLRKPHFSQSGAANTITNDASTSSPQARDKNFNNKRHDKQNQDAHKHAPDNRSNHDINKPNQDNKFNREFSKHNNQKRQPNDQGWNTDRRNKTEGNKKFDARTKGNDGRRNPPAGRRPALKRDDDEEDWGGPAEAEETRTVKTVEKIAKTSAVDSLPVAEEKHVIDDIPPKSIVESVPIGEAVMISVEQSAARCKTDGDYVCVAMHESYEKSYQGLCEDYLAECEVSPQKNYNPSTGELYSLYEPSEGAWYRARCLGAGQPSALVDAARLADAATVAGAPRATLPRGSVHANTPEFSCVLVTRVAIEVHEVTSLAHDAKIGQQLKCDIVSRDADGACTVKLANLVDSTALGDGVLKRWRPTLCTAELDRTSCTQVKDSTPTLRSKSVNCNTPKTVPVQSTPDVTPSAPLKTDPLEPDRPQHKSGVEVVIVDATALDRVFLRAADAATQRAYDMCIEDVALFGQHAQLLTQPPSMGQLVIAKFSDDIHYRALVTRTNVKQNKYLLEYIEFGNIEKTCLERLYKCPPEFDLSQKPALASRARLHGVTDALTAEARNYLEDLKENGTPLIVSLPDGAKTAASGSEVILTVAKNMFNVNKKLQEMCMPQWKQMQEQETKITMLHDIQYVDLPANGGLLQILDDSMLSTHILSACEVGDPNIPIVLGPLTDKMAVYCESEYGREPYLPRTGELCIARFPPHEGWFRAVVVSQEDGPGSPTLLLLYLDYGNSARVSTADVRRMLPEFTEVPALACHVQIKGLPTTLSTATMKKIKKAIGIEEEAAAGRLRVTSCKRLDQGMYEVTAPDLLAALGDIV